MQEKNRYETPELDIVQFTSEDVITVSGTDNDGNQGEWDPLPNSVWSIF